jgi:hypothetical protein
MFFIANRYAPRYPGAGPAFARKRSGCAGFVVSGHRPFAVGRAPRKLLVNDLRLGLSQPTTPGNGGRHGASAREDTEATLGL